MAQGLLGGWNHSEQKHGGKVGSSAERRPLCKEGVRERKEQGATPGTLSYVCEKGFQSCTRTCKSRALCSYHTIFLDSLCSRALP